MADGPPERLLSVNESPLVTPSRTAAAVSELTTLEPLQVAANAAMRTDSRLADQDRGASAMGRAPSRRRRSSVLAEELTVAMELGVGCLIIFLSSVPSVRHAVRFSSLYSCFR